MKNNKSISTNIKLICMKNMQNALYTASLCGMCGYIYTIWTPLSLFRLLSGKAWL